MGLSSGDGKGLSLVVIPAVSSTTYTSGPINVIPISGISIIVVNIAAPATVNLPAIPALNQICVVQDGSMNASANNITVQGNGNNINNPNGVTSSYVIGSNGTDAWFNWNGSAWGILG